MYELRSSNSLLLMMRLFTLATISSTMAAGVRDATVRRDTTARRRTRAAGGLIPVFARVVEGENGSVDMDLRVLLEVCDVALESLLPFLAEQLQLDAAARVREVGVLRLHRAHLLENEVHPGVFHDRTDLPRAELEGRLLDLGREILFAEGPGLSLVRSRRVVPCQALELRGVLRQLRRQPLGHALIIDQDLAQHNRAGHARGLGLPLEVVVDLAGRHLDLAQHRLVLHFLQDQALAHLVAEGLLPLRSGDLGLPFADPDLAEV